MRRYPASMMKFVWLTDENCIKQLGRYEVRLRPRCLASQKLDHLATFLC